jgi:hypothetical protein
LSESGDKSNNLSIIGRSTKDVCAFVLQPIMLAISRCQKPKTVVSNLLETQ